MSTTSLDSDVRRIEGRLSQRTVVNLDRRQGSKTLVIVQVGDTRQVWAGTGDVAAGASSTVYLTLNGEAGGETVFKRAPLAMVYRDLVSTQKGIVAASGPIAQGQDWSVGYRHDEVDFDVKYLGNAKTFAVVVTNNMATTENFVIVAWGVA